MMVLKIGGGEGIHYEAIFRDLKALLEGGEHAVIVHGANHAMSVACERMGYVPRNVTSVSGYESRVSDPPYMDIFTMVYRGQVNASLVALAQSLGINAVGLCGLDGALLTGPRKKALRVIDGGKRMVLRDDLSGKIDQVNTHLLDLLLEGGYLPLVCPPALSEEQQAINVDGDRAAAMIASAMHADKLVILSNVPGLLRDKNDDASLIAEIKKDDLPSFEGFAEGRMKKKVMAAGEALAAGVPEVIFADARSAAPVTAALGRSGTWIH